MKKVISMAAVAAASLAGTLATPGTTSALAGSPLLPRAAAASCVFFAPVTALDGVTAVSPSDAWAVGQIQTSAGHTALIEHWNGSAWTQMANPGGPYTTLAGVAFAAARDGWAVGSIGKHALVEHWDGTHWTKAAIPALADSTLSSVAAVSATDAWAVGAQVTPRSVSALVLHWDGHAWTRAAVPDLSGAALAGVTATSASNAWAAGYRLTHGNTRARTLTERWNGTAWSAVASPDPGSGSQDYLWAVTATGTNDALAVGSAGPNALTEHFKGTSWAALPSHAPAGSVLAGVTASSAIDGWAVGSTCARNNDLVPLTDRWNGRTWTPVPSPAPAHAQLSQLSAVAMTSASNAWAVGWSISGGIGSQILIEHWTGTAWQLVPGT